MSTEKLRKVLVLHVQLAWYFSGKFKITELSMLLVQNRFLILLIVSTPKAGPELPRVGALRFVYVRRFPTGQDFSSNLSFEPIVKQGLTEPIPFRLSNKNDS